MIYAHVLHLLNLNLHLASLVIFKYFAVVNSLQQKLHLQSWASVIKRPSTCAPCLDATKVCMVVGSDKNVKDLVRLHLQLARGLDVAHEALALCDFNRCRLI